MEIKNNNKIMKLNIFLMLSLIFIFPLNFSNVYSSGTLDSIASAADETYGSIHQASVCSPSTIDIRNSLVLSVVTLCLPGILEKTERWKQIKCQSAVCKYEAVVAGLDPSFCERQEKFQECKEIYGEATFFVKAIIEYIVGQEIMELLKRPVGVIIEKLVTALATPDSPGWVGAYYVNFALGLLEIKSAYETLESIADNGVSLPESVDYCQDIEKIGKELEKIIEVYEE